MTATPLVVRPAALSREERRAAALLRLGETRARLHDAMTARQRARSAGFLDGFTGQVAALVQRHPGFSAAGAVVLGALLARARPWRFVLSSGLWAMLLPRVMPTVVSALAAARLGPWSELITTWLRAEEPAPPSPTPAPSPGAQASTRPSKKV